MGVETGAGAGAGAIGGVAKGGMVTVWTVVCAASGKGGPRTRGPVEIIAACMGRGCRTVKGAR